MRRKLFFWIEKLQISKNERIVISSLLGVVITVSLFSWLLKNRLSIAEGNYERIEEAYNNKSAAIKRLKQQQEEKYEGVATTVTENETKTKNITTKPKVIEPKIVNINTADLEELQLLKGIGRTYAERIVEYRNQNGEFKSVDELMNVKGIGKKRLESIKQFVILKD